jgi:hypothetical protein
VLPAESAWQASHASRHLTEAFGFGHPPLKGGGKRSGASGFFAVAPVIASSFPGSPRRAASLLAMTALSYMDIFSCFGHE